MWGSSRRKTRSYVNFSRNSQSQLGEAFTSLRGEELSENDINIWTGVIVSLTGCGYHAKPLWAEAAYISVKQRHGQDCRLLIFMTFLVITQPSLWSYSIKPDNLITGTLDARSAVSECEAWWIFWITSYLLYAWVWRIKLLLTGCFRWSD